MTNFLMYSPAATLLLGGFIIFIALGIRTALQQDPGPLAARMTLLMFRSLSSHISPSTRWTHSPQATVKSLLPEGKGSSQFAWKAFRRPSSQYV